VPKSNKKTAITGLIQKAYLGLVDQTLLLFPEKFFQYKEIFMTDSKFNKTTQFDWELQQAIVLPQSEIKTIQSVGLFSSVQGACYMFVLSKLDKQTRYYGYCSDLSYPTPIIIDFNYDKVGLVLKILLISGDEEWQSELIIN